MTEFGTGIDGLKELLQHGNTVQFSGYRFPDGEVHWQALERIDHADGTNAIYARSSMDNWASRVPTEDTK